MSMFKGETAGEKHDKLMLAAFEYATPIYPYNDVLLQAMVLEKMGYPIHLTEIDVSAIPNDIYPDNEYFKNYKKTYQKWAKGTITNPAFENWLEFPDNPGDMIDVGNELNELLKNHPMQLVSEVDYGDPAVLAYYLEQYQKEGNIPGIMASNEGILSVDLLEKCFLACFEQNVAAADMMELVIDASRLPQKSILKLYHQLKNQGQVKVSSVELMLLIYDYYSLAEQLSPEFAAFRQ